jgi:hypothetical protein
MMKSGGKMKKSVLWLFGIFLIFNLLIHSGCETAEDVFDINGGWAGELISTNTIMFIVSPSVPLTVTFTGSSNFGTTVGYIGTSSVLAGTYTITGSQIEFSLDIGGGFVVNFNGIVADNDNLSGSWTVTIGSYTGIWTLERP